MKPLKIRKGLKIFAGDPPPPPPPFYCILGGGGGGGGNGRKGKWGAIPHLFYSRNFPCLPLTAPSRTRVVINCCFSYLLQPIHGAHRLKHNCLPYIHYTVIRFVSISAKFAICTVVGLNETIVEAKLHTWRHLNVRILASRSVPFRPTTNQMPNIALVETKEITVKVTLNKDLKICRILCFAIHCAQCTKSYMCTS